MTKPSLPGWRRIKGRFVKAEELHLYHQGLLPGQDGVIPYLPPLYSDAAELDTMVT